MSESRTARFARGVVSALSGLMVVGAVLGVAAALVLFTPGNNAAAITEAAPGVTTTTTTLAVTSTTVTEPTTDTTTTTVASDVLGLRLNTPRAYRVGRGQSLDDVAAEVGVSVDEILALNGFPDASLVEIGTVLLLPAAPDEPTPVPAVLVDDPERAALGTVFERWAEQYNVPAELAKAVAWHESAWDNDAEGPGIGIGQLDSVLFGFIADSIVGIPLDPSIPAENIQMTVAYLGWLLDVTEGDTSAALAAFDQGLVSPRDLVWDQTTVDYLSAVLALRPVFDPRAAVDAASGS
ncbi:MAG: transglycosylase SLT domain-containing protein [Acidimicrobiia bacterium]|nr:transglycosylase SLT domain-containing protein [Acidimicrobiia bacterium]